jgi:hypothetical protein
MKRIAVVMAMLVGASVQASAQHMITTLGPVSISCGTWLEWRANNSVQSAQLEWWTLGFVSGVNVVVSEVNTAQDAAQVSDFLKGGDPNGLFVWLDNFCRKQPLDPFPTAVGQLTIELKKRAH